MKRIGYINGMRIKGKATNVGRIKALKRSSTGAVSLVAAPVTKLTFTPVTPALTTTKSFTLGLPGTAGGRNFVNGKLSVANTNTTKKITATLSVKTLAGTAKIGTFKGTKTAKVTTGNTVALPMGIPGTIIVKAKGTAGKVKSIKAKSLSVNDLTTMLM